MSNSTSSSFSVSPSPSTSGALQQPADTNSAAQNFQRAFVEAAHAAVVSTDTPPAFSPTHATRIITQQEERALMVPFLSSLNIPHTGTFLVIKTLRPEHEKKFIAVLQELQTMPTTDARRISLIAEAYELLPKYSISMEREMQLSNNALLLYGRAMQIEHLIHKWQQKQHPTAIREMGDILRSLSEEQKRTVAATLLHIEDAYKAACSEIDAVRQLHERLSHFPEIKESILEHKPGAAQSLEEALRIATPERIAQLPQDMQNSLELHVAWPIIKLFPLEAAYRAKDMAAIMSQEPIALEGFVMEYMELRGSREESRELYNAVQYYKEIRKHCYEDTFNELKVLRHSMSIDECKNYLIVLRERRACPRVLLDSTDAARERLSNMITFFKVRIALETNNLQELSIREAFEHPDSSVRDIIDLLPDDERQLLERKYAITSLRVFRYFAIMWSRLQQHQTEYETALHQQPNLSKVERERYLKPIFDQARTLYDASERDSVGYNQTYNEILQYTPTHIKTLITQTNSAISYINCLSSLGYYHSFSPEQKNFSSGLPHRIIEEAEAIIARDFATTPHAIINNACTFIYDRAHRMDRTSPRITSIPMWDSLIKHKIKIDKLRNTTPSDSSIRSHIIWQLAQIQGTMNEEQIRAMNTQIATLYPQLLTSLNSIQHGIHYAKLLLKLHERQSLNQELDVELIISLQDVAMHFTAEECDTLLRSLRQIPNFDQEITDLDQLFPIIRTDMECLRQIERLSKTPSSSQSREARGAILDRINQLRTRITPDHYAHIIKTLTDSARSNRAAKALLKNLFAANIELACRYLETTSDTAVQSRCLFEMGEIKAKTSDVSILFDAAFLQYIQNSYPASQRLEKKIQYAQLLVQIRYAEQPLGADFQLQLQDVALHMDEAQCTALVDELRLHIPNFNQRFTATTLLAIHSNMECFRTLELLLRGRQLSQEERAALLRTIESQIEGPINQYERILECLQESIATNQEARELARNMLETSLEIGFLNLQEACRDDIKHQNKALFKLSKTLVEARELEMMLQSILGEVPASQIIGEASLNTLSQRYPAIIRQEEIEYTTALLLLQKYSTKKASALPEEMDQINTRYRSLYTRLGGIATRMGRPRYDAVVVRIQSYKPEMQSFIDHIRTVEFEYNMLYRLSRDHYNKVRLENTIPPLTSTTNPDAVFTEGLTHLFRDIDFTALQGQLTERGMTQDTAQTTLKAYIDDVINMAPIVGAPSATNLEARREFWNNIKRTIIHVITHIQGIDARPQDINKKKIIVLATLIESKSACATRRMADAIDLYQQIVLNKPVTFETCVYRELNGLREANAQIISEGEAHAFAAFLRLIGRELAIPGTEALGHYDDPFYAQTDLYRLYEHNRAGLQQKFEETYTPYAIISSIQQEVGPQGRQDTRDLFWKWCYDNTPLPQYWGITREAVDWGRYLEDIQEIDAAKKGLQEERIRRSSPADIARYLEEHRIQRRAQETPAQAILRKYSIILQTGETPEAAVDRSELDIQKRAYLDQQMYEVPPSLWTMKNRQHHLKVKKFFIATLLVQMGVVQG